jgi:SAM-dependent methyltransferase
LKLNKKAYASIYAKEDVHWWFLGRRKVLSAILEGVGQRKDGRVLDVGCGTGGNFPFLENYGRVEGCDYSEEAIRFCNLRGGHEVTLASIYDLPYGDESFDLVTCLDVIEHLRFDLPAFQELGRVLKPGGHLVVTLPVGPHLYSDFDCLSGHLRRYRFSEVDMLLRKSGLDPLRISCYTLLVHPVVRYYMWKGNISKGRSNFTDGMETFLVPSNKILKMVLDLEARIISRWNLPRGSSLVALARKGQ